MRSRRNSNHDVSSLFLSSALASSRRSFVPPQMAGYYHSKKPYTPTRSGFPRRFFEPWKILVALVVLCLLFFFRFDAPATTSGISNSLAPTTLYGSRRPLGFSPYNESRIAIVTFTTEQKSFTHLSLKNKARKRKSMFRKQFHADVMG